MSFFKRSPFASFKVFVSYRNEVLLEKRQPDSLWNKGFCELRANPVFAGLSVLIVPLFREVLCFT